jgi:O-antigen ligase
MDPRNETGHVQRMQMRGIRQRSVRFRLATVRPNRIVLVLAPLVAWGAGSALASGGRRASLTIAIGLAVAGATILAPLVRDRLKTDFAAVELPALFILLSELVLRQRDAESLASNPLDSAGLYRVGCLGLAALLGTLALTSSANERKGRITTRPFRLYCLYVGVVFVGAPLSINLPLTAFRGVELLVGLVAVAGAYRRAGREAGKRLLALFYWYLVTSVISIWLGALIVPGSAFVPVDSPFPIQLHGLFPVISSNGTGMLGAMIGLWSLAKLLSPQDRGAAERSTLLVLTVLGFATLTLAQYRTGYIATAAGLLVLLTLRANAAAFWVVMVGLFVAILWSANIAEVAAPIWQRGENQEVLNNLSGRINYWQGAIPVWESSPLFGRGLRTASRFEVLAEMGSTYTSTIHGTWVEALVGTGLVGLSLLAASFLLTSFRAFKESLRPGGLIVPLLLLTILAVRSITGVSFENGGSGSLLLMTIALLIPDPSRQTRRDSISTSAGLSAS